MRAEPLLRVSSFVSVAEKEQGFLVCLSGNKHHLEIHFIII